MEKLHHDQTKRHIINVPVPFTEEGLKHFITLFSGLENDPEAVTGYLNLILREGHLELNPSAALGFGADVVDVFSFGLLAVCKAHDQPAPDISNLWFHPCRSGIPVIKSIKVEYQDCAITSNEHVMYFAKTETGEMVSAAEAACPGNSDNLQAYES